MRGRYCYQCSREVSICHLVCPHCGGLDPLDLLAKASGVAALFWMAMVLMVKLTAWGPF